MIHFLHPLVLLLLVPLALWAFWLGRAGRPPAVAHSSADLIRAISRDRRTQWGRLLPLMRWIGAALLVVALARPNVEHHRTEVRASGVDVLLAVDVSGSMQAKDMPAEQGPMARLDAAKEVVGQFIQDRPSDRIGLLAFAG
ncbi:MAG TPA: BatA domain-containing protein, partial [Polyangiaceae bacterium]